MLVRFIRFTGVGAIGTLVHYLILILLVHSLSLNPVLASTMGFFAGAVTNYLLNYYYTFSSDKPHLEAVTKFFVIAFIGMLLNGLIMALCTNLIHLHYLLSQVLATALILFWNFTANHMWTFHDGKRWTRDAGD